MKNLELKQMENIEGGKFWGSVMTSCTAVTNGAGGVLYYYGCSDYYMLWIRVTSGTCNFYNDNGCSSSIAV